MFFENGTEGKYLSCFFPKTLASDWLIWLVNQSDAEKSLNIVPSSKNCDFDTYLITSWRRIFQFYNHFCLYWFLKSSWVPWRWPWHFFKHSSWFSRKSICTIALDILFCYLETAVRDPNPYYLSQAFFCSQNHATFSYMYYIPKGYKVRYKVTSQL